MVIGSKRFKIPSTSKMLGDYAVGESVFLNMNGVAVEHLVVNQGIPQGSSLYDSSCDGTWLIPKDIVETRQFNSANSVYYNAASIHTYLNGDYLAKFDRAVLGAIKRVKIPHITGTSGKLTSGANGLSTMCFLLGNFEVGCIAATGIYADGACLDYFSGINSNAASEKRIAYLNGTATRWWLRSPHVANYYATTVAENGVVNERALTSSFGIRPAIILPYTAQFDGSSNFKDDANTIKAVLIQRSTGAVTCVVKVDEDTTWADIDGMEISSGMYVWAYSDGYVRISNGLHAGMPIGISKDPTATKSTVLNTDVIEETTYYALI